MKGRRARLAAGVHNHRPLRILGAEIGGRNFDFRDHVRVHGLDRTRVAADIGERNAVLNHLDAVRAAAVGRKTSRRTTQTDHVGVVPWLVVDSLATRRHVEAGQHAHQLRRVAANHRERLDIFGGDHIGVLAGVQIPDFGSNGLNRDLLSLRPHREFDVLQVDLIAGAQGEGLRFPWPELRDANGHRVAEAVLHGREDKIPDAVAGRLAHNAGLSVD